MLKKKVLDELEARIDAFRIRDKDMTKERKVMDEVFDRDTLLTVYKMFSEEIIDTIEFSISTGKEANVFYATSKEGPRVAKIFRITTSTFKTISKYIMGDPRFRRIKGDKRRAIFQWSKKEFRNLSKALNVGVRVPEAIVARKNVLIMEYIGTEERPAPLLKDYAIEDAEALYEDLVHQLRLLYHKADMIHSDLSEFNILMHEEKPYLIDMGQAVLRAHPMAQDFFKRDAKNLSINMRRRGVDVEVEELMDAVRNPPEDWDEGDEKEDGGVEE